MTYLVVEMAQVSSGFVGIPIPVIQNVLGIFSTEEMAKTFVANAEKEGRQNLLWYKVFSDADMTCDNIKSKGLAEVKGQANIDYSDYGNGVMDMLQ